MPLRCLFIIIADAIFHFHITLRHFFDAAAMMLFVRLRFLSSFSFSMLMLCFIFFADAVALLRCFSMLIDAFFTPLPFRFDAADADAAIFAMPAFAPPYC